MEVILELLSSHLCINEHHHLPALFPHWAGSDSASMNIEQTKIGQISSELSYYPYLYYHFKSTLAYLHGLGLPRVNLEYVLRGQLTSYLYLRLPFITFFTRPSKES